MKRLKNSKQEMISIPQEVGSILAEGLTFKGGSLSGVGKITLNCYFVGNISTNDLVIVDEAGNILGDIEAQSVIIRGNVKGNIVAVEGVQIQSGGVLNGNITCADLNIASGAAFSGECNMTASKKENNILVSIADKSEEKPVPPLATGVIRKSSPAGTS
ncbi:MAG: polymer-forming cytoskeletal protein [Clostridiales bacterium]|jgi:cytoskeletal protein CcmA (bactofilin family)|nr:polymer-forming cytoskeletal protein [Clostridiales bacterium]